MRVGMQRSVKLTYLVTLLHAHGRRSPALRSRGSPTRLAVQLIRAVHLSRHSPPTVAIDQHSLIDSAVVLPRGREGPLQVMYRQGAPWCACLRSSGRPLALPSPALPRLKSKDQLGRLIFCEPTYRLPLQTDPYIRTVQFSSARPDNQSF